MNNVIVLLQYTTAIVVLVCAVKGMIGLVDLLR